MARANLPSRRFPSPWSLEDANSACFKHRQKVAIIIHGAELDEATIENFCDHSSDGSDYYERALAQTTTPNVVTPIPGLSTPLTFTTTTCMMTCNSQVVNSKTACVLPVPPTPSPSSSSSPPPILNQHQARPA